MAPPCSVSLWGLCHLKAEQLLVHSPGQAHGSCLNLEEASPLSTSKSRARYTRAVWEAPAINASVLPVTWPDASQTALVYPGSGARRRCGPLCAALPAGVPASSLTYFFPLSLTFAEHRASPL